jgi:hypothetical protein
MTPRAHPLCHPERSERSAFPLRNPERSEQSAFPLRNPERSERILPFFLSS